MRYSVLFVLLLVAPAFAVPQQPKLFPHVYRVYATGRHIPADTIVHDDYKPPFPNWDLYWETNGVYAMWHDGHTGDFYFCTVDGQVCVLTGRVVFYYDGNGVN